MIGRTSLELAAALALALAAGATRSQGLSDPTRPPADFYLSAGPAQPGEGGSPLVLQSVLIYPDARSAIISGEHVLLGQRIGSLRLVKIAETEVVLMDGAVRRTLKLFPGLEKRPAAGARTARRKP
jgi:hypothetical protein